MKLNKQTYFTAADDHLPAPGIDNGTCQSFNWLRLAEDGSPEYVEDSIIQGNTGGLMILVSPAGVV